MRHHLRGRLRVSSKNKYSPVHPETFMSVTKASRRQHRKQQYHLVFCETSATAPNTARATEANRRKEHVYQR